MGGRYTENHGDGDGTVGCSGPRGLRARGEARAPVAIIRTSNIDLADQLDGAADSVHQNLAEGGGHHGADRVRFYRYSYGSLREVRGSLEIAVEKGWLDGSEPVHAIAYRLGGLLYRLAKL